MLYEKRRRDELRRTQDFKRSNEIWNRLKLNHGFVVGYLMRLISQGDCKSHKEWELYYLNSGKERLQLIEKLPVDIKDKLNSFDKHISREYFDYNLHYGRTETELLTIAKKLDEELNVGLEMAFNFVYIRVIDETWIGYHRECLSLEKIEKYVKNHGLTVEKANFYVDVTYGVDFELKRGRKVVAGIQLKSINYFENKDALTEIECINKRKNNMYENMYKVPVIYLYVDKNNCIVNLNDIYFNVIKKKRKRNKF